jgi:hypothetical protein
MFLQPQAWDSWSNGGHGGAVNGFLQRFNVDEGFLGGRSVLGGGGG